MSAPAPHPATAARTWAVGASLAASLGLVGLLAITDDTAASPAPSQGVAVPASPGKTAAVDHGTPKPVAIIRVS